MKRTQHHSMSVLTGNTRSFSKAVNKQDLAFGLVVTRFGFACISGKISFTRRKRKLVHQAGKGLIRREKIVVTQGVGRGSKVHESFIRFILITYVLLTTHISGTKLSI